MDILKGLLYINDVDIYQVYNAYLSETSAGDHKNYDSLMKPGAAKGHVAVDFREENGERYPAQLLPASSARDVELQFAIVASEAREFLQKYTAFLAMLKAGDKGWLNCWFSELGMTFRLFYKDSSGYEQLTHFNNGNVGAIIRVSFREPNPSF